MYRVSKSVSFCYGHRLINYTGKCRYLHGHNARAVITLETAGLDERGMVEDFTDLKHFVRSWLEREIDHTLLLHRDDPVLALLQGAGERVRAVEHNPTAEYIARMIFEYVAEAGYPVTEVSVWETDTSRASYRRGG
jgi:6-pyruvoyltetrahydropterin/6-carboxytetrahydropterin synthase